MTRTMSLVLLVLFSFACQKAGKGPFSVRVSWTPNHETLVNSAGGGYRVYWSTTKDFDLGAAYVIDVPYVSGSRAPSSTLIQNLSLHAPAEYYFKVVAYSSLGESQTTDQFSVAVP